VGKRETAMSEASHQHEEESTLSLHRRVDEVCLRFERAWKAGPRPALEDYMGDTPEPERALLCRELIALDLAYRHREGETPRKEDYAGRFPFLCLPSQLHDTPQVACEELSLDVPPNQGSSAFAEPGERRFLEPGTLIDQCRIERLLGFGGMGEVYLAEHM